MEVGLEVSLPAPGGHLHGAGATARAGAHVGRQQAPPLLLPTASEAAMNAIRSLALILTPTPT